MAMTDHSADDDEKPLDPEQQRIVAKVRWLMLISGLATVLGIAVVIGVIGYRVYRSGGNAAPAEVTATLPKGAKVIATGVADDRLAVTIETGGTIEVRTFDLKTLRPTGRLRFATEP
jgi:cytochrome c biogenesis protein CcdA